MDKNTFPIEIWQAITLWCRGDSTIGTIAGRLNWDPSKLKDMLEANLLCDFTGQPKDAINPTIVAFTILHAMIKRNRFLINNISRQSGRPSESAEPPKDI